MQSMLRIFDLPKPIKNTIKLIIDFCCLLFCFWAAFFTRIDAYQQFMDPIYWLWITAIITCSLYYFSRVGMYRAVFRYVSAGFSKIVLQSVVVATLLLVLGFYISSLFLPRSLPFIYFSYVMVVIGGSRLLYRNLVHHLTGIKNGEPVIIYGAGAAGRQLYTSLAQSSEYKPIAFVDIDPKLHFRIVHDVNVFPVDDLAELIEKNRVQKILLAIPSASRQQRKQVLAELEHLHVKILTVPGTTDVVSGDYKIDQIKSVDIVDLLGRECVQPNDELMHANIKDKVVMVTGAGGSIGSELCRQIIFQQPTKLILFDASEFNLYSIEKELSQLISQQQLSVCLLPLMGSVQVEARLHSVMSTFKVETIYHAAAYKHVPLVEHNVTEGVCNNIFGTLNTARAAIDAGVKNFVLISTDKAVRPTNVMGATKRMAELVLQALSKEQSVTRFCMVRFGNVLGSSGSVVPLFKQQISQAGPVTVTDKDIIRYFMTIPEAAQLVIQAGSMGKGGDVFVLDMGEPVKIYDLARNMIHLSGFDVKDENNPLGDIEIKVTGLRPGEKLYEELLIGDNVAKTQHQRIMSANEVCLPWAELEALLAKLQIACLGFNNQVIREILLSAQTDFKPKDGICDLVWVEKLEIKKT
jgi:FlaA1/EpsC-like NDP-sugar epimerase